MPRGFDALIGDSPLVVGLRQQLQQLVRRYAGARRLPPMLLLGETGTGKSLIARALHSEGPRAGRPFVDVNCAAIPETLMEAEMFGFERGAFTDARQSKPGLFAAADRGIIFLDEIGLLPDSLQAKLLKVVEDHQVRPLGGTTSRPIDVWIIAATSENLEAAVQKRRFREDLYHRLAVVTIRVPPLRERSGDVVILVEHLLRRACAEYGLAARTLTAEAVARLRAHHWPGNIRELGNVIERVALLSETTTITAESLGLPEPAGRVGAHDVTPARSVGARPDVDHAVAAVERDYLVTALAAAGGNVTRAAQRLGLTRNTLRYRLRKHGVPAVDAASMVVASASSKPRPESPRPGAITPWERRRVAFLRVRLIPADGELEHRNRELIQELSQKILGFGGMLDGASPVGVSAVFGLDRPEDAPRRAAHAALVIRKLASRVRDADPTTPNVKLGIHVQHTLLGRIGDTAHVDMDARAQIWPALDRLIAEADGGVVVVSGPAAASLRTAFSFTVASPGGDGTCVLLDGEQATGGGANPSMFVGRRDELAMLQGRLELARGSRGQVVAIGGEAGIGKSRALFEFHHTLDPDGVVCLGARCVSYGRDVPLFPIVDLVRQIHGIEEDDSPPVISEKLRAKLTSLGLPADEAAPYLLRLLGINQGAGTTSHLAPPVIHQLTVRAFCELLLAVSRERPLVVSVEDLHWLDRASEAYMTALVDSLAGAPIFLLTTHRTGYRLPWSDRSYVMELRLQPLARADAQCVLEAALDRQTPVTPLPSATGEAILDRADGNPFFIEELARAVPTSAAAMVPESIEAVLLARIDRLSEDSRRVIQAASVLGRDVSVPLLEAIIPDVVTSTERLRELQQLEYLYDRSDGARRLYRFKHALTQEVAYSSLLPGRRRTLHVRVVGAFESQYTDRLVDHAETLGHHAVRGQLWEKAVGYLRQAGLKAVDRFANHEAIGFFEQALDALRRFADGPAVEAVDLHVDLSRVLLHGAAYRACLDHLEEAVRFAEALGDRRRLGHALADQSLMLRITGATASAIDVGRQALAIARELGDVDLAGQTNLTVGAAHHARGEFLEAARCYRESVQPVGEITRERARALPPYAGGLRAWLAWSLESLGEFPEALAAGREAVQIAEARDDRGRECAARCLLANVHLGLGDPIPAIPLLEQALVLCRSHDVSDWLAPVTMRLGYAYTLAGRMAEGIPLLEEGGAHAEAIGAVTGHATRLAGFAEAYLRAGRHDRAEEIGRRGVALARTQHQPSGEAWCLRVLGVVAGTAEPPNVAAAEECLTRARDLATRLGMRPLVAHCHRDLSRLYRRTGKPAEAHELLLAATTMYREMDMRLWLEKAEAEVARR
jgi:DNA-binding NtrC family response regulator/tetratricopeptide (TPR) repeat protein